MTQTASPTAPMFHEAPRFSAAASRLQYARRNVPRSKRGTRFAFALLVLACGVLFLRPTEIIPSLDGCPIYEAIVLLCCAISVPILFDQAFCRLRDRPINVCVLGMFVAVVLSHLSHLFIWGARHSAVTFGKLAVVYLLIVGLIDTPARMKKILFFLSACIVLITGMAMLQYHHVINLPQLAAYEERETVAGDDANPEVIVVERLRSAGIFNDPNDLSLILMFGLMTSLYFFGESKQLPIRLAWLACAPMFVWALYLTHSRGGFMALASSLGTLIIARIGWKRAIIPIILLAPILLFMFAGRQTDLNATEGTAQARVHLWSEALTRIRQYPIFGIGMDQFVEQVGLVVHNSFLQCFAELGMLGGMLFLGAFIYSASALRRLGRFTSPGIDPALVRLRPFLLGILVAYAVGFMSLSRSYSMPTYLLFGLFGAYLRLAVPRGLTLPRMGIRMLAQFAVLSVVFIFSIYIFVRLVGRWG